MARVTTAVLVVSLAWAATAAPETTAEAVARLGSADAREREAAAWTLGALADPVTAPRLVPHLSDPDRDVRLTAAWALSQIGTPAAMAAVGPLLFEGDEDLARFVLAAFTTRYGPEAEAALVRAVQRHPSPAVRVKALELLDKNFTPELLPVFQSVAEGPDGLLKLKALPILVRRKALARGDDLVPLFAGFVGHADPKVRLAAIQGLRGFEDERVLELLEQAIADKDPAVHAAALSAFGSMAGEREIKRLFRLYTTATPADRARIVTAVPAERWLAMQPIYAKAQVDAQPEPRRALVRAMRYRFHPDPEVTRPFLMKGAQDVDTEVRAVSAGGLASLPSPPMDVLRTLVRDKAPRVRADLVEALAAREDGNGGEVLEIAVGDADADVQLLAIEGVAKTVESGRAAAVLQPVTRDPKPKVRALAVRKYAAVAAGQKGTAELVLAALEDPAPEVRAAAADAVGASQKGEWVETLGATMSDASPLVRQAAMEYLKYQGGKKATPFVAQALSDPEAVVRRMAVMGFQGPERRPDPAVVAKLKELRQADPDFMVRAFAETALRSANAIPGESSAFAVGSPSGSLPADVLPLFVFPGSLPREVQGKPNLRMLGRYEATEPGKTPEGFRTVVVERDPEGRIHYTSWGQTSEVVTGERFRSEPEYPGLKSVTFWSASDGGLKTLSWTKDKRSEGRGVISFVLGDDGRTLTYSYVYEGRTASDPAVEAAKESFKGQKNQKKLAEWLLRMGLKEGPQTTYTTQTFVYRRVGS